MQHRSHFQDTMATFRHLLLLGSLLLLPLWSTAQQPGTGLIFDDEGYEKVPMKAPLTRNLYGETLPKQMSLKRFCPTPQSQGNLGTCVGWASNWAARTIIEAMHQGYQSPQTIEQHAFSPGFIYHMIKEKKDKDCMFGSSIHEALNYMKFNGSARYTDFDMQCSDYVAPEVITSAEQYKLKDFARLFGKNKSDDFKVRAVKKSLSEYNPVVIGLKCPLSLYEAGEVWTPYEQPETVNSGHAVCVVGYDDSRYGGAFEIMNSWGTEWGDKGFTWVTYQDFARFTKYAYELIHEPLAYPPSPAVAVQEPVVPAPISPEPVTPAPLPEPPVPTTEATADLSGACYLITDRGKKLRAKQVADGHYALSTALSSGTSFRVYLANSRPAYVYMIGSDATGEIFQLFPYSEEISPMLNYRQNVVALPSESHYITLDDQVGRDYLCVIYSKKPLAFEAFKGRLRSAKGAFPEKVRQTLAQMAVSAEHIQYERDAMGFVAKSNGQEAVSLILSIEHVE